MDAAHLAAGHAFGPCLTPTCPNYIGRHPAHRGATDEQLQRLQAAHRHLERSASRRDARTPLTLVPDTDER